MRKARDWDRFERLCLEFLAFDFRDIRQTANPSGDKGRDSELFSPEGEPTIVLQYSLREDWELQFQWEDDTKEKGLTKIAFDALVKSVLRNTSSEQRLTRQQIITAVQ